MWLMYIETGEKEFREAAEISEKQLDRCFEMFYGIHHDVGFMYMPTAVMDHRITGNEESRKRGMHAASLLAGRFNPAGNFIRAWNENYGGDPTGRAIIDCMMNLSLLYWASEERQDPRFRHIAEAHAHTVMKYFVREDGSVCHIVDFDPETGAYISDEGGQGFGKGSSWSRGQAWAMYGFTVSYLHTGKKRVSGYCGESGGVLYLLPPGERDRPGGLPAAGEPGMGGLLRGGHPCLRPSDAFGMRRAGSLGNISVGGGEADPDDQPGKSRLRDRMRCGGAELQRGLPRCAPSFSDDLCGLLLHRGASQIERC